MNLQQQDQFYQVMSRVKANSRATEMINGLLVSKSLKKEPEIIDLQDYANSGKAASVPGINKMKAIHDFIRSNGRI